MSEQEAGQEVDREPSAASRSHQATRPGARSRRRVWMKLLLALGGTVIGLLFAEVAVRVGVAVLHRDPLVISNPSGSDPKR